jgi:hypothetical protein
MSGSSALQYKCIHNPYQNSPIFYKMFLSARFYALDKNVMFYQRSNGVNQGTRKDLESKGRLSFLSLTGTKTVRAKHIGQYLVEIRL